MAFGWYAFGILLTGSCRQLAGKGWWLPGLLSDSARPTARTVLPCERAHPISLQAEVYSASEDSTLSHCLPFSSRSKSSVPGSFFMVVLEDFCWSIFGVHQPSLELCPISSWVICHFTLICFKSTLKFLEPWPSVRSVTHFFFCSWCLTGSYSLLSFKKIYITY